MHPRGAVAFALLSFAASAVLAQTPTSPLPAQPAIALVVYPSGTETPLGAQIHDLLAEPGAARAHWGIAVTALDGTPIFGLDEAKLFRPASTAKLFTTAAAMALLGPDTHFETSVYGDLNVATGIVKGDLVLLGGGDAGLGVALTDHPPQSNAAAAALNDLISQMRAKGVRSVTGNIVGDDNLFLREPPPEGWAAEDLVWSYGALPSALSLGDNELRLTVRPQAREAHTSADPPASAAVELDQLVPYVHLSNNVETSAPEEAHANHIDVQPVPAHAHELAVLGSIAPGAAPVVEHIALPDPAQYTAEALRFLLAQHGVPVSGKATSRHSATATVQPFAHALDAPPDCESDHCEADCLTFPHPHDLLARHGGATVSQDIHYTLKTSANLHAEVLLRQLEAHGTCAGASSLGGARQLRAWLLRAGIPDHDFFLFDGSGLSTKDLVTPRAEAQLLAYAAGQPWSASWKAALPLGGVDGTLSARFSTDPLKGHVFAKTGTLGESRALAGYVLCASGRELIFAVLDDNHEPGTSTDRTTMDRIVAAIAASN